MIIIFAASTFVHIPTFLASDDFVNGAYLVGDIDLFRSSTTFSQKGKEL
jgi:hypothetical protein